MRDVRSRDSVLAPNKQEISIQFSVYKGRIVGGGGNDVVPYVAYQERIVHSFEEEFVSPPRV